MFCSTDKSLSPVEGQTTMHQPSSMWPSHHSDRGVRVCLYLNNLKYPAGRIFTIYFDFYEYLVRLKPSHMKQSLHICMFLTLCHASSADAYDLFRVLDNQQKKDKILPADKDVKQHWTHGPYNHDILLFMCKEWREAIMLFRYDFKNSDVK